MSDVHIEHHIQHGAIHVLLSGPQSGVLRTVYARGQRVRAVSVRLVGVDTGRLRSSIDVSITRHDGLPAARVGSTVHYAYVHHEGHHAIRPRSGKYLVFRSKRSGKLVFTTRVRAVRGNPYLTRALPAARI